MQRTYREELRWAQQAKASINARATATYSATRETTAGPLPGGAALQRVRIPALGMTFALQPEARVAVPDGERETVAEGVQLALPAAIYGESVCRLDRLRAGDTIFLETKDRAYSYTVREGGLQQDGEALAGGALVMIAGYPCGEKGEQVLVAAAVTSH